MAVTQLKDGRCICYYRIKEDVSGSICKYKRSLYLLINHFWVSKYTQKQERPTQIESALTY
jgi:hypothetical protein